MQTYSTGKIDERSGTKSWTEKYINWKFKIIVSEFNFKIWNGKSKINWRLKLIEQKN